MKDDWAELLANIAEYIYSRTPEQLQQIDKDIRIEEIITPFGTLRIIHPHLFGEN